MTSDKDMPKTAVEFEGRGEPAIELKCDTLWKLGYVVAFLQLGMAAILWGLWGNWEVFVVTAFGTVLSFLAGSMHQWRRERWSCRRLSRNATYVITRGNGAQHALVIFAKPGSLNLEDLAASTEAVRVSPWTKLMVGAQLILWVALLVTVDGLDSQTWFLILIGALGMLYTILAAVAPRKLENWGIKLESVVERFCITSHKVMLALIELEMAYPGVGLAALDTFFPGAMSQDEQAFWDKARTYFERKNPNKGARSVNSKAASCMQMLDEEMKQLSSG